ncbi:rod shape-determining protein MreC [Neisseriaceae bacterium TC5R-5]|nr:rod shape-determining protein MreC [Neisseriaceae bacterium TC5R-5]
MDFANTPSFFRSGPPLGARLAMAVVASIALLLGDYYFDLMRQVRDTTSLVLYPLQRAVNMPAQAARHASDFISTQVELKHDNTVLRTRQLEMSAQLSRLATLERELSELRELNQLKADYQLQTQMAETLYTGRDPFSYKIIIDKGGDDLLKEGQPVVDAHGLLGQVSRVQPLTAEVTLIIDKNQMVPVMLARTGQRAILYGYGGGVEVRYLPQGIDVKEGDLIVTSGIDGVYPQGIPVAQVSKVERNQGAAFARLTTRALAGVQQARYVLVLKDKPIQPRPTEAAITTKKSKGGKQAATQE